MALLRLASRDAREAATDFVGRIAQLDPMTLIRLMCHDGTVDLWSRAGFGVVATRSVAGVLEPSSVTVHASDLIGALAVSSADDIDPGRDAAEEWHTQLPPPDGWQAVGHLPTTEIARHVRAGLSRARDAVEQERANELAAATKATVPPRLLDSAMMSVDDANGERIPVSMRMLFALSGMGFADPDVDTSIRVAVTRTWLRLDATRGSVTRRRMANLPLA